MTTASYRRAGTSRALEVLWQGFALLAAIQFPGAIFDYFIRHDIGPPEILFGFVVSVAAVVLVLHRLLVGIWHTRWRPLGAAAVAFAVAAASAQAAPVLMSKVFVPVEDVDILIPTPGRRLSECRGEPRRCHEYVLNELGFRGALVPRATHDAKLIAFVGDSYIFGSGVGDDDTVPARVERQLSDVEPPVTVVNAGIEGLSGGSFPGVMTYLNHRLHPDAFVVLFKDDDLDETDILSRWDRFRRSFWFRLLYVVNVEPIYETARQLWRFSFAHQDRSARMTELLDAIAGAASGAKLILLTELSADLRPAFDAWLAAHPGVAQASAWDDPRFAEAERIPHDGHWTEAGCRQIAAIALPVLRAQLAPPIGK